ncbi:hypothetical protein HYH03_017177 [Edaphochlamys debaryana]|uniref:Uncharacterized protein n=1 Tax=Edaphochlamys debaryana TaxID=47281 RepID=A0A835XN63_9CHLO|nr:hypothetical protein HYH03_017177 [Edaphochlamys debaryana]|eukprot:KAG2484010.1 hypothetical protein HYH03_017177 [Edaphochlamys debaryana]
MLAKHATLLATTVLGRSSALSAGAATRGPAVYACARLLATEAPAEATSEASTSGQPPPPGWLGRELKPGKEKGPPLGWMYMREGPDGVKRLMPWSERLIWGAVLSGISYFVVPRIYNARKRAAEEKLAAEQRRKELEEKRLVAIRLLLVSKDWLNADADPFEGMSPKQIVDYIKDKGLNPEDPFEGMSPEEIDAFVEKTGVSI